MNVIIWMLGAGGVMIFLIMVQECIFPLRFVISEPRQNDLIFTQKCNDFQLLSLNLSQVSVYTPPKPLLDITDTLGDSNIRGYRFRKLTSRDTVENLITFGHCKKNYKYCQKKPIRFKNSKSKF